MAQAYVVIGKLVNGKPALVRSELAHYVNITFTYVEFKTGVDLYKRIIQAKGGAAASAGVHLDGAAFDFRVWGLSESKINDVVYALRECGYSASWYRDWEGNEHIHAGANLGSLKTGVKYQVDAVKAGYDGTGKGGRGAKDNHRRPSTWRTIQQGSQWAAEQILKEGEVEMATATEIANAIMAYKITANGKTQSFAQHLATMMVQTQAQSVSVGTEANRDKAALAVLQKEIKTLSAKIDELKK